MIDLASDKEYADALANARGAPSLLSLLSSRLNHALPLCHTASKTLFQVALLSRAGTESCGGFHCSLVWPMCVPPVLNLFSSLQEQYDEVAH